MARASWPRAKLLLRDEMMGTINLLPFPYFTCLTSFEEAFRFRSGHASLIRVLYAALIGVIALEFFLVQVRQCGATYRHPGATPRSAPE